MQSSAKVATCRDCTKAFVLVGKRRGIVFVKMALGGLGLLRSEGLGEVWQRESLTNLYPMRLASRPFTPATCWLQQCICSVQCATVCSGLAVFICS